MKRYVTVGISVLAGVALFEAALIPGMVIGGAAVLAPKYLSKYLPKRRRRLQRPSAAISRRRIEPAVRLPERLDVEAPPAAPAASALKQAIAKTITFRIIATTVDFAANYVVIGELATAAGLSAFTLVAAPLFYFVHETAWTHFSPSRTAGGVPLVLISGPDVKASPAAQEGLAINRALAKTITFRTIATVMDFITNYVVVGDLAKAVGLSAFGFVVGPFVYLGHEMAWDYYGSPRACPGKVGPLFR
jgi:uncharacterized membrane protein